MVFATETLALGINMPARCVIVEKLEKFNGSGHVPLTPGEFTAADRPRRPSRHRYDRTRDRRRPSRFHTCDRRRIVQQARLPAAFELPCHVQHGRQSAQPQRLRDDSRHAGPFLRPVGGRTSRPGSWNRRLDHAEDRRWPATSRRSHCEHGDFEQSHDAHAHGAVRPGEGTAGASSSTTAFPTDRGAFTRTFREPGPVAFATLTQARSTSIHAATARTSSNTSSGATAGPARPANCSASPIATTPVPGPWPVSSIASAIFSPGLVTSNVMSMRPATLT